MTPTKLLTGQIMIVFAIVILGVWVATQWAAGCSGDRGLALALFALPLF